MSKTIAYFFTIASPWAYLGHAAFVELAKRHGASIDYKPTPIGQVFPETGGLPLAKRHPTRQRYRLIELQRWRQRRGLELNLMPEHVPFNASLVDRAVIAADQAGRDPDGFIRRAFEGVWAKELNLAEPSAIEALANAAGLDGAAILHEAASDAAAARYEANLREALDVGVFGAPAYIIDGEVFWGQDRLDLIDDMLGSGRAAFGP